jgi:BlaI family penicillinase repressor
MSSPEKQLTDLEWEIMNHIWNKEKQVTVREILDEHYSHGEKAYTTVQTVMNTLVEKGFMEKERIGMANFYTPTQQRDSVVKKEINYFVDKVFRGSMPQFVKHFIDAEDLSQDEITELKQLIEQREDKLS